MRILLVAFVLFLAGCQSQPAPKATVRKYPPLWCDYHSPEVFHLSDTEYKSAAEKYAKAKYGMKMAAKA
jgi:PBP1b-binding outer membrane lipoprotein LpoB